MLDCEPRVIMPHFLMFSSFYPFLLFFPFSSFEIKFCKFTSFALVCMEE